MDTRTAAELYGYADVLVFQHVIIFVRMQFDSQNAIQKPRWVGYPPLQYLIILVHVLAGVI